MYQYQVRDLTLELMKKHGLIEKGWKFEFDNGKRRFGLCRYAPKIISISKPLSKLNDVEKVTDVILHEIAHALTPNDPGHGYAWKLKCAEIGAMPVAVKRGMGIKQVEGAWKAKCPNPDCDFKVSRHRKPHRGARYSCSRCSGKYFNWRYELTFKKED